MPYLLLKSIPLFSKQHDWISIPFLHMKMWVPHLYGLVPHLSKKFNKLQRFQILGATASVGTPKQMAFELLICPAVMSSRRLCVQSEKIPTDIQGNRENCSSTGSSVNSRGNNAIHEFGWGNNLETPIHKRFHTLIV